MIFSQLNTVFWAIYRAYQKGTVVKVRFDDETKILYEFKESVAQFQAGEVVEVSRELDDILTTHEIGDREESKMDSSSCPGSHLVGDETLSVSKEMYDSWCSVVHQALNSGVTLESIIDSLVHDGSSTYATLRNADGKNTHETSGLAVKTDEAYLRQVYEHSTNTSSVTHSSDITVASESTSRKSEFRNANLKVVFEKTSTTSGYRTSKLATDPQVLTNTSTYHDSNVPQLKSEPSKINSSLRNARNAANRYYISITNTFRNGEVNTDRLNGAKELSVENVAVYKAAFVIPHRDVSNPKTSLSDSDTSKLARDEVTSSPELGNGGRVVMSRDMNREVMRLGGGQSIVVSQDTQKNNLSQSDSSSTRQSDRSLSIANSQDMSSHQQRDDSSSAASHHESQSINSETFHYTLTDGATGDMFSSALSKEATSSDSSQFDSSTAATSDAINRFNIVTCPGATDRQSKQSSSNRSSLWDCGDDRLLRQLLSSNVGIAANGSSNLLTRYAEESMEFGESSVAPSVVQRSASLTSLIRSSHILRLVFADTTRAKADTTLFTADNVSERI